MRNIIYPRKTPQVADVLSIHTLFSIISIKKYRNNILQVDLKKIITTLCKPYTFLQLPSNVSLCSGQLYKLYAYNVIYDKQTKPNLEWHSIYWLYVDVE